MWNDLSNFMSNFISYTLHFDGAHTNQFQKSGAGCIIRDNKGQFVVAASYNLGETNPESMNVAIVEATALRNGLKLAESYKIKLDRIKGDNKEIIDHVRGQASRVPKSGSLSKIIEEIKVVLNGQNFDPFFKIELISREGNQVADSLACEGSKLWNESKIYIKEEDLPIKAAKLFRLEKSLTGGVGGVGGGNNGLRNFTTGPSTDYGGSSNSSMAETIGMAGAAVAGIAMVAWGVSKLFFGDETENKIKNKAKNNRSIDHKLHVLHVDGLDSQELEQAAAGCIIRDEHGELVIAAAYNLNYCHPTCHIGIAEAMALKKGLELAQEFDIKLDLVRVDNEEVYDRVYDCVLGCDPSPPKVPKLIDVIEDIGNSLNQLSIDPQKQFKRIPKDKNNVARALANVGRRLFNQERKYYDKGSSDIPKNVTKLIDEEKTIWHEIMY